MAATWGEGTLAAGAGNGGEARRRGTDAEGGRGERSGGAGGGNPNGTGRGAASPGLLGRLRDFASTGTGTRTERNAGPPWTEGKRGQLAAVPIRERPKNPGGARPEGGKAGNRPRPPRDERGGGRERGGKRATAGNEIPGIAGIPSPGNKGEWAQGPENGTVRTRSSCAPRGPPEGDFLCGFSMMEEDPGGCCTDKTRGANEPKTRPAGGGEGGKKNGPNEGAPPQGQKGPGPPNRRDFFIWFFYRRVEGGQGGCKGS